MIPVHYIQAHLLLCSRFLTGPDWYLSAAGRLGTPGLEVSWVCAVDFQERGLDRE